MQPSPQPILGHFITSKKKSGNWYPLAFTTPFFLFPFASHTYPNQTPITFYLFRSLYYRLYYEQNHITYGSFVISFFLKLIIKFSRFIHDVVYISTSFPFMAKSFFIIWIFPNFFICSSIDQYLGCFHLLVIMTNTDIKIHVQVSMCVCIYIFFFLHFS